jgi:uncharacterized protein (DUF1015 family)
MPQLLPFAGLRPNLTGPLDDVVCPPYDVISGPGRLELLARSPLNVVRLELPDGHYEEAAGLLQEWTSTGVLAREERPALYGYRMSYVAPDGRLHQTLGVMGALVLEPPGQGILPHEHTTPKAKSDRLDLLRATKANTSPIWCLCSEPGLASALGPVPATTAVARDDEGVLHEIWPLLEPAVHKAVAEVVGAGPLLVADGHHRYETALAYQTERRSLVPAPQASPAPLAGYDSMLAFVVELSREHLQVQAIHRLVSGLPAGYDLLGALAGNFDITPARSAGAALLAELAHAGALGAMTVDGYWLARPRDTPATLGQMDLDSSRIDAALAALPAHRLSYEADLATVEAAVRSGKADAAVLCRPATVEQIARTARGGERMPPKTTYFWPKLRTGMVLRDLDH